MPREPDNPAIVAADEGRISRIIEQAFLEDSGMGDITSEATIDEHATGHAHFLCKGEGIIAGFGVVAMVFATLDDGCRVTQRVGDGEPVSPGTIIASVDGSLRSLLRGERVALNILQRMSGIATLTHRFVQAVAGTGARITDTRKTVPGLRVLDKMAVRLGGGVNHRFGLDDMVLIKDNHIVAAGSITKAVAMVRNHMARNTIMPPVEVETTTIDQVREALACDGITRIMLDNFTPGEMHQAVSLIGGRVETEASGGIGLDTVRAFAETGVDFISIGALTHSVTALDISLELTKTHV